MWYAWYLYSVVGVVFCMVCVVLVGVVFCIVGVVLVFCGRCSLVPRPHPQMGKGLVTFERFLGCAVSAERTRLHTVQYVLCHMRAVWLSHDC